MLQQAFVGLSRTPRIIFNGRSDSLASAATVAPTPDAPCVADWDATSYTANAPHCLRRTDTSAHYPENLSATSVHRNGLIWSGALWDIRNAVGRVTADTVILEAHFSMGLVTTMAYAAEQTVATAQRLYDAATAAQVRAAFEGRGIL